MAPKNIDNNENASEFPPLYLRRLREMRARWTLWVTVLAVLLVLLPYGAVYWGWDIGLTATAVAFVLFLCWVTWINRPEPGQVYVVLCFENESPATRYFPCRALVRDWTYLDELAVEGGASPLSAFGFTRRRRGAWHDTEQGLETVSYFQERLREQPSRIRDGDGVREGLEAIRHQLRDAQKVHARFRLDLSV